MSVKDRAARRWRAGVDRWTLALRHGSSGLVVMAVVIGAGAGVGAVVFRWLVVYATAAFTGRQDYAGVGRLPSPSFPHLGWAFVVITPIIGGLMYGPLVARFAPEARGHGVPEVMYAVSRRGGRIPARVAGVKALASAICIGSGGSVGREGPIVQIGSALGSGVGQFVRVPETRLRTLVACGAAGGIAATFNAPIAGVFFALELILGTFEAEAFGAVVLAAVTASVIGRAAFGDEPFLRLPPFSVVSPWALLFFVALGAIAGCAAVLFTRILYAVEDACDWVWRGPEWVRPAVGGLLLGLLLLVLPQMYGVGYPVLESGVAGRYAISFLLVLLIGKMIATSLTIGIGGSGGVFAPSLFCGAMVGAAFGTVVHGAAPGVAGPSGAYALVAMGAMFAGAARAPITAVIIMFELTGEYSIILPLMLAVVVATAVSRCWMHDTIYTLKLRRRGVDLTAPQSDPRLASITVGDVMAPPPDLVPGDLALPDVALLVLASGRSVLPVAVDGRPDGVVTAAAVSAALADGAAADPSEDPPTAASVREEAPGLTPRTGLREALDLFAVAHEDAAPVLDEQGVMVGWLDRRALLAAVVPAQVATRSGNLG